MTRESVNGIFTREQLCILKLPIGWNGVPLAKRMEIEAELNALADEGIDMLDRNADMGVDAVEIENGIIIGLEIDDVSRARFIK